MEPTHLGPYPGTRAERRGACPLLHDVACFAAVGPGMVAAKAHAHALVMLMCCLSSCAPTCGCLCLAVVQERERILQARQQRQAKAAAQAAQARMAEIVSLSAGGALAAVPYCARTAQRALLPRLLNG